MKTTFLAITFAIFITQSFGQIGLLNKVLEKNPKSNFDQKYKELITELKNDGYVASDISELKSLNPDDIRIFKVQGWFDYNRKRFVSSFENLNNYLKEYPEDTLALEQMAYSGMQSQFKKNTRDTKYIAPTISAYDTLIQKYKKEKLLVNRGITNYYTANLYYSKKEYEKAKTYYQESTNDITNYQLLFGHTSTSDQYLSLSEEELEEMNLNIERINSINQFIQEFKISLPEILTKTEISENEILIDIKTIELALTNSKQDELYIDKYSQSNNALNRLGKILNNIDLEFILENFSENSIFIFPYFNEKVLTAHKEMNANGEYKIGNFQSINFKQNENISFAIGKYTFEGNEYKVLFVKIENNSINPREEYYSLKLKGTYGTSYLSDYENGTIILKGIRQQIEENTNIFAFEINQKDIDFLKTTSFQTMYILTEDINSKYGSRSSIEYSIPERLTKVIEGKQINPRNYFRNIL